MPDTPLPNDTGPDIVVIARRDPNQPVYFVQSTGSAGYVTQNNTSGGGGGGGTGGTAVVVQGIVNVQVDNVANLTAAKDAAQNVAQALLIINELLSAVPANTPILWNNVQTTAGAILALLAGTEWVVTDRTYDNGGVGASYTDQNGRTRDYLNYQAYTGPNSYAAAGYTNNEGMVGILLHELGHLSTQGSAFTNASQSAYLRLHNNSYDGYFTSNWFYNNEMFANDFLRSAAIALNFDLRAFNPRYGYGSISPSRVR